MSGFEHFEQELNALDREIRHRAALVGITLGTPGVLETLRQPPAEADSTTESLRGLLLLRLKVETEMLELGLTPPPLCEKQTHA